MQQPLIDIRSLSVCYPEAEKTILHDVNLTIAKGEITCVIGESGSGKSTLMNAIVQLPGHVKITNGQVLFDGEDFSKLSPRQMRSIRGYRMGVIFQEPGASLNPIREIYKQFYDVLHAHNPLVTKADAKKTACELLQCMSLDDSERILESCPSQLSGGMNQRVAMALAMVTKPDVLLADEPTSALDAAVQIEVMDSLLRLREDFGTAILMITHNMGVAKKIADKIAVMQDGRIVEYGAKQEVFQNPRHPYTRMLLAAVPKLDESLIKEEKLKTSGKGLVNPILEISHVIKTFRKTDGSRFRAVDDVSIIVGDGECVGIVGESGSGKTTLASLITGLIAPDSGMISVCGQKIAGAGKKELRRAYAAMKLIFQEPRSSFDPRMTLGESIDFALKPVISDRQKRSAEAVRLMKLVGLDECFLKLYPSEVSGGECQRAAIARAIAQGPRLLICDEATSALDVSVQAQIINLLNDISRETGLAILFISHDIALVSSFCDRVYVLHDGRVVEHGITNQVIHNPVQTYTKKLVESVL